MSEALYTKIANASQGDCPLRQERESRWMTDLPLDLKDLVVAPVSVDLFNEYEMQADGAQGRDTVNAPCFYEFRYVLTQLRSDDDEVFYEAPVYAETLTSWRMIDERWLVCRTTLDRLNHRGPQTRLSVSDRMPR